MKERELIALLQSGKNQDLAFRELLNQFQEKLYWHIRRMVIHHEDANDVLQNTFIKVFRNIKHFKGDSKLYTWLYRIATNETITYINKQKRKMATGIDQEDGSIAAQLKADSYFDGDEAQIKLKAAIDTLPEKQKLVFNMRYYDDMTYLDISEVLETSVGGLKASYHHAVKKIEHFIKTH